MTVQALYALQNGFMGASRSLLFYGEYAETPTPIPIACWLIKTSEGLVLFDTGRSPRAVPGLMRNDPWRASPRRTCWSTGSTSSGSSPTTSTMVVMSHLHYDHAGGAHLFPKAELIVQRDEYSYANYPASFFEPFYYKKNFDLPGYRWRLLDGDTELAPGLTVLRTDGHTPGHQSLLVHLPQIGPGAAHRRRVLLDGARRARARAWRGVESRRWRCTRSRRSRPSPGSSAPASSRVTIPTSGRP